MQDAVEHETRFSKTCLVLLAVDGIRGFLKGWSGHADGRTK